MFFKYCVRLLGQVVRGVNRILEIFNVPIMILNFGGIVGCIWLHFFGEWKLIGIGILFLFTSHWILSVELDKFCQRDLK